MAFVKAFLLRQPEVFRLRWELGIRFSNMFARYFWTQVGSWMISVCTSVHEAFHLSSAIIYCA